jgi:predicted nucleotidyltransferase
MAIAFDAGSGLDRAIMFLWFERVEPKTTGVLRNSRMNHATRLPPSPLLAEFCQRHHIRRLSLFGSVLREDFRPDSDVDMLVEFQPGYTPGWEIVDLEEELGELFGGRRVDLVNPKYLNPRLRETILDSARVQYAEG